MPHVPDTVPGKRVTDAGARTEGRGQPSTSEVGAVCRKAARTVLCGGRPVMGVPTAIRIEAMPIRTLGPSGMPPLCVGRARSVPEEVRPTIRVDRSHRRRLCLWIEAARSGG